MAKSFDIFAVTRRQAGTLNRLNNGDVSTPLPEQVQAADYYGYCIACSRVGSHQEILGDIIGQSLVMQCPIHGTEGIALSELREVN